MWKTPIVALAALIATCLTLSAMPASSAYTPAPAQAKAKAKVKAKKCRAGWVSLTFDDGPSSTLTPTLVKILVNKRVPATFFMVGERVAGAPETAKLVASNGFRIANHTYAHEDLTTLSRKEIRATLRETKQAMRAAGIRKPIKLMRPPYGAIDRRVKRTARRAGYVPVLWNADSLDWSGGSTRTITKRVLRALSPGGSIVLQHDGITNSPNSVAAVPRIIKKARARGYCFTALNAKGRLIVPKPRLSLRARSGHEGQRASVEIRLNHPVPVPTSVWLSTREGRYSNAAGGKVDFQRRTERITIPAGASVHTVDFALRSDDLDEPTEVFFVDLSAPHEALLESGSVKVRIEDASRPPGMALDSTEIVEPDSGTATAQVRLRLGRPSAHDVVVTVVSSADTADVADFVAESQVVRIPAGQTSVVVPFRVNADKEAEPSERFAVTIATAINATIYRGEGQVTIVPSPTNGEPDQ